ncbi:MAG: hypothetical protein R3320_10530, partial [Nitriliruptorales bacterium]|nr:hypothetical protein [Nitriliruptorales bacterium]
LSSHILDEVEAVADTVAILRRGRLMVVEAVESLKAQALRRIELTFDHAPTPRELELIDGVREVRMTDVKAVVVVEGSTAPLFAAAAPYGIVDVSTHDADLEEIFLTYYSSEAP